MELTELRGREQMTQLAAVHGQPKETPWVRCPICGATRQYGEPLYYNCRGEQIACEACLETREL